MRMLRVELLEGLVIPVRKSCINILTSPQIMPPPLFFLSLASSPLLSSRLVSSPLLCPAIPSYSSTASLLSTISFRQGGKQAGFRV